MGGILGGALLGVLGQGVAHRAGYVLINGLLTRGFLEVDLVAFLIRDLGDGVRLTPPAIRGQRGADIGKLQRVDLVRAQGEGAGVGVLGVLGNRGVFIKAALVIVGAQAQTHGHIDDGCHAYLLRELDKRRIGGVCQRFLQRHRGLIGTSVFHAVAVRRAAGGATMA